MPHLTVTAWVSMPNLPVAPDPTQLEDTLSPSRSDHGQKILRPDAQSRGLVIPVSQANEGTVAASKRHRTSDSKRQTGGCHHPPRRRPNKRLKTSPLNVPERARKIEALDSAYPFTPSNKAKTKSKKALETI